jgi:hypothetical protein
MNDNSSNSGLVDIIIQMDGNNSYSGEGMVCNISSGSIHSECDHRSGNDFITLISNNKRKDNRLIFNNDDKYKIGLLIKTDNRVIMVKEQNNNNNNGVWPCDMVWMVAWMTITKVDNSRRADKSRQQSYLVVWLESVDKYVIGWCSATKALTAPSANRQKACMERCNSQQWAGGLMPCFIVMRDMEWIMQQQGLLQYGVRSTIDWLSAIVYMCYMLQVRMGEFVCSLVVDVVWYVMYTICASISYQCMVCSSLEGVWASRMKSEVHRRSSDFVKRSYKQTNNYTFNFSIL